MKNIDFIEGLDYNLEEGFVVFTSYFLIKRGYCCGCICTNCPYEPSHIKGNTELKKSFKNDEKDLEV